jgi:hypothetical protein
MFALVLLCGILGSDNSYTASFVVDKPAGEFAIYLKDNPGAVLRSTGASLVSRHGDVTRVYKPTIKGPLDFSVRETVKQLGPVYKYTCRLEKSYQGNVTEYEVDCSLTPQGNQSRFDITASMSIDNPRIRPLDIHIGLKRAVDSFHRWAETR